MMEQIETSSKECCGASPEPPRGTPRYAAFGPVQIDLHTGWLYRNGSRMTLPAKGLQVLKLLLEHADEVVSRDEIRQKLWPAGKEIDYAANVNTCVNRLRRELGCNGDYIRTVTGTGYCWTADVRFSDLKPRGDATQRFDDGNSKPQNFKNFVAEAPVLLLTMAAKVVLTGTIMGAGIMALWTYRLIPRYSAIISSLLLVSASVIFTVWWVRRTVKNIVGSHPLREQGSAEEY